MHIVGLIPFKSPMVHPITLLYFFSTCINFSSSFSCNPKLIISGQLFSTSRKTYFRFSSNCFNYVLVPVSASFFVSASRRALKSSHRCSLDLNQGDCSSNKTSISFSLAFSLSFISWVDKLRTLSKGNLGTWL